MKTRRSVKNGSSKTQHQEKHKLFSSWLLTRFQFGDAHTYSVKDAGTEAERRGIHVLEAARCTQLQQQLRQLTLANSICPKDINGHPYEGYHFFQRVPAYCFTSTQSTAPRNPQTRNKNIWSTPPNTAYEFERRRFHKNSNVWKPWDRQKRSHTKKLKHRAKQLTQTMGSLAQLLLFCHAAGRVQTDRFGWRSCPTQTAI